MPVVARFEGGPRNGRKNTLKNHDFAPAVIPVEVSETKAVNMRPGRYVLVGRSLEQSTGTYSWEPTYAEEMA